MINNATKKTILFFIGVLFLSQTFGQSSRYLQYSVEVGGFYSVHNKVPFWLKNNQFGSFPSEGNTVMFRQTLASKPDSSANKIKKSYGLQMVTIVGKQAKIVIPELYYQLNYKKFAFMVGRKRQIHGLVDTTLSSGSITWSGNALPVPELQLSIPDYTPILSKFISVKGHYSHGWFGNQPFVSGYFLHQKSLYGRLGKPNAKLKLYGGVLHNVQWGGHAKYGIGKDDPRYTENGFAHDWYVYRSIVFPTNRPIQDSTKYSNFDIENKFGNHIGQLDLGAEIRLKRTKILVYKQIIFETGQTFSSLTNIDDGLYGLSISSLKPNAKVKKAVVEVLHTTNQGMYRSGLLRLIGFQGKHYGRNQNYYFNHSQYMDGWSYNGLSLGTPFMIPSSDIRNEKQSDLGQLFANNNRIKAIYLGLESQLNSILVHSRFSYSRNFGSPAVNLGVADQLSISFKACVPAPKLKGVFNISVGIEQGDLINDNYGWFLSFKRMWK
jgi:Capsule assembly protein Wzi